ncbi:MAG: hypothetical protein ABL994_03935, partial [Verrucomicrobiales bacterium]
MRENTDRHPVSASLRPTHAYRRNPFPVYSDVDDRLGTVSEAIGRVLILVFQSLCNNNKRLQVLQ